MQTAEALRATVAEFFGTQPEQIGPDFPIAGPRIQGSMSKALLDAAIRRRTGVKATVVHTAKTYAEIEAAVLGLPQPAPGSRTAAATAVGSASGAAAACVPAASPGAAGIACGVDVETVESLPRADDHWSHEFYKANFTRAEIAYCLMQDAPATHFCGRWCAKEALKKCDAAFLKEEMSHLEVVSHPSGAVSLRHHGAGGAVDLPHALSLSHTPLVAVAVVVRGGGLPGAQLPEATAGAPPTPALPHESPDRPRGPGGRQLVMLAVLAAVGALVVAVASLVRTL